MSAKCWRFKYHRDRIRYHRRYLHTCRKRILRGCVDGCYQRCTMLGACHWWSSLRKAVVELDLLAFGHRLRHLACNTCPLSSGDRETPRRKRESSTSAPHEQIPIFARTSSSDQAPGSFFFLFSKQSSLSLSRTPQITVSSRESSHFIVILAGGITYTIYTCLAASLSAAVIAEYNMNYLTAGLIYLPNGVGGILSSYASGKLLDHDYKVPARRLGLPVASRSGNEFPFAKARLRSIFPVIIVSAVATMGYGWVLHTRSHIAILLVVQFFSGAAQVCIFATCGTLLTDLNPGRSSTVQASYSLVRCALSGAGVAALETMVRQIGYGLTFTVFGSLGL